MKLLNKLIYLCTLSALLAACGEDQLPPNGYIETTEESSSTLVLKGYESYAAGFSVLQPAGFNSPFYLKDKAFFGKAYKFCSTQDKRLDAMNLVPEEAAWQESIAVAVGNTYWARYTSLEAYRYIKFRVAYIDGNNVGVEYVVSETITERPNRNANTVGADGKTSVTLYEIPALSEANYYADHYVTVNGEAVMNYALEWNQEKKHSAWVAFSFDELTSQRKSFSKQDDEMWDPELPAEWEITNKGHHTNDGFDKGHICASADRYYVEEANAQTFYFSNFSPMIADFNQGIWVAMENHLRNNWSSAVPATYEKLYVTKGGTIDQLLTNFNGTPVYSPAQYPKTDENGFTVKGLACPKYYYMAILAEKADGTYQAIAFWIEHKEGWTKNPTVEELQALTVSVDQLEQNTGIDFFCNLPDDVEDDAEAYLNVTDWAW